MIRSCNSCGGFGKSAAAADQLKLCTLVVMITADALGLGGLKRASGVREHLPAEGLPKAEG